MKCDPWPRRHALCLVYVTQSLVGASLFVFNLSAAKVCLFLQLLALLQKKMRTFLYLPLGDRYGSSLTRNALLPICGITKTRYAVAISLSLRIFLS